jgi:hypothetical protein
MKTPIQEVIIKLQKFIQDEIEHKGDWEIPFENAKHIAIGKLEYEEKIFMRFFVAGIMLGKQDRDFDLDEEFKKFIKKEFTS